MVRKKPEEKQEMRQGKAKRTAHNEDWIATRQVKCKTHKPFLEVDQRSFNF
jgi:hypothetical protein